MQAYLRGARVPLPSWVPDFARILRKHGLSPLKTRRFHASSERQAVVRADGFELSVKGISMGIVEDVMHDCLDVDEEDPPAEEVLDTFRLVTLPTLVPFLTSSRAFAFDGTDIGDAMLQSLCRVLTIASPFTDSKASQILNVLSKTDTEDLETVLDAFDARDLYEAATVFIKKFTRCCTSVLSLPPPLAIAVSQRTPCKRATFWLWLWELARYYSCVKYRMESHRMANDGLW